MIKEVVLRRFKRFQEERFDLTGHVILAGPNNCGKTTVLQSIAAWSLGLKTWKRLNDYQRHGGAYTRAPIARQAFTAVPLRSFDLLWKDRSYYGEMEIEVLTEKGVRITMEFRSDSTEQIFVRPKNNIPPEHLYGLELEVVYVATVGGLSVEEPVYQPDYIETLLGRQRPGDVIRNLLLQASKGNSWEPLKNSVARLFGVELMVPQTPGGQIVCEYSQGKTGPKFDLLSAGSGFQQVVLLLASLFTRKGSVVLVDEPDAHLHVFLQDSIFAELRKAAADTNSQLVLATHSEVIFNSADPEQICVMMGKPRRLASGAELKKLQQAVAVLQQSDLVAALSTPGILYLEGYTDLNLLREWARAVSYTHLLYKAVWPVNLSVFYPLPGHIPGLVVAASAAFLVFISIMVWLERKRSPCLIVGWLWFAGTLVPVIGLVQVGDQAMADRYTYFPLIGIFSAVTFFAKQWADRFQFLKTAFAVTAVLILAACLALTENQLRYWHDNESLFRHALEVSEESALAHLNLGVELQDQNKPAQALVQYQEALRLDPSRHEAYNNIGRILIEQGKPQEALDYCRTAVQLDPKSALSRDNLGLVLVELRRFDEAMREFSEAARLDAQYATPHFETGRTLLKLGRDAEALPHLHEALNLAPDNFQMLIYVARVLAADETPQIRNGTEACALAGRASQLAGGAQPVALDTLAMAYAEAGRFDEAVQTQELAVKFAAAAGQKDDAAPMQQRLQLYKNHQPWRESFSKK